MLTTLLIELVIGLLIGLCGGLLGVGGSIVAIPALTIAFGADQHRYQAAAMILNFFVVVPAVYQHRRAGALDGGTVARLVPTALVAVSLGVVFSELPVFAGSREVYLEAIFGLFLIGVCVYEFVRLFAPDVADSRKEFLTGNASTRSQSPTTTIGWGRCSLVAIPIGLLAGLLGVGGGVVAVPIQHRLLHIPLRRAIANSAALIIATSAVGAVLKNLAYAMENADDWSPARLAAVLIPTAILGSLIGARLTHVLPLRVVKIAFFFLLAAAAVRLMADVVAEANGRQAALESNRTRSSVIPAQPGIQNAQKVRFRPSPAAALPPLDRTIPRRVDFAGPCPIPRSPGSSAPVGWALAPSPPPTPSSSNGTRAAPSSGFS